MSTPVVTPQNDDRQPDLVVTDDFGFDESVSIDQLRTQAMTAVATPQPKPPVQNPDPTPQPDPDPDPEQEEEEEEEEDDDLQSPPREYVQEIDLGDGSGVQVFRGRTKDELIQKLVTAQTNATRKIRELNQKNKPAEPTALTAEQEFLLGQELLENPSKAFDKIFAAKFGMTPVQLQAKLKTVEAVEQERVEQEISEQFLAAHPEFYACPQNADRIDRYFKRFNLDRTIENLNQVYADLSSDGLLLERPTAQPQPAGDTDPQPTTERIAQPANGHVAPRKKAASGLSGRRSAPAPVRQQGPTEEELYNMPIDKLEALARQSVMPSR